MATFTITGLDVTEEFLSGFETGTITRTGQLVVSNIRAIEIATGADTYLSIDGSVTVTSVSSYRAIGTFGDATHIQIGPDGRVSSTAGDAIGGQIGSVFQLTNLGTILGGDDQLFGDDGNDLILAGDGNDSVFGGNGEDTINANAGDDTIFAQSGNDVLVGQDGADLLDGGAGNDILDGGAGNDILEGGSGNDILRGRGGEDDLAGGLGLDLLTGGQDADSFVFRSVAETVVGANRDQILDLEQGLDLIVVSGLSPGVFEFRGTSPFSPSGNPELRLFETPTGSTIVQIDTDGDGTQDAEIRVANVTGLTAEDFVL